MCGRFAQSQTQEEYLAYLAHAPVWLKVSNRFTASSRHSHHAVIIVRIT